MGFGEIRTFSSDGQTADIHVIPRLEGPAGFEICCFHVDAHAGGGFDLALYAGEFLVVQHGVGRFVFDGPNPATGAPQIEIAVGPGVGFFVPVGEAAPFATATRWSWVGGRVSFDLITPLNGPRPSLGSGGSSSSSDTLSAAARKPPSDGGGDWGTVDANAGCAVPPGCKPD